MQFDFSRIVCNFLNPSAVSRGSSNISKRQNDSCAGTVFWVSWTAAAAGDGDFCNFSEWMSLYRRIVCLRPALLQTAAWQVVFGCCQVALAVMQSSRRRRSSLAKPFVCEIADCRRTFFRGSEMYRHQREKHGAQHIRPRGNCHGALFVGGGGNSPSYYVDDTNNSGVLVLHDSDPTGVEWLASSHVTAPLSGPSVFRSIELRPIIIDMTQMHYL